MRKEDCAMFGDAGAIREVLIEKMKGKKQLTRFMDKVMERRITRVVRQQHEVGICVGYLAMLGVPCMGAFGRQSCL